MMWIVLGLDRVSGDSLDLFSIDKCTVVLDPDFDLGDSHAQKALYETCIIGSNDTTMRQQKIRRCFIVDFAAWVRSTSGAFPVPSTQFVRRLQEYLQSGGAPVGISGA